jgi:two-component system chemotaxis response regulator CheY
MVKRILVVDDSKTLRDLAAMTLEVMGDDLIETASDGLEAQRLLQEKDFDLVLTDLDMPHMGGDELIGWMKSEERCRNIPVIVLTAGVDQVRVEIARKYQIQGLLEKPFQPAQLAEVVRKALR